MKAASRNEENEGNEKNEEGLFLPQSNVLFSFPLFQSEAFIYFILFISSFFFAVLMMACKIRISSCTSPKSESANFASI